MIIFNEEKEDIVEEKHICYYTKDDGGVSITLMEIVEKKIKHPSAKEFAFIHKFDCKFVDKFDRTELAAAATILLEASQNNSIRDWENNL